MELFFLENQTWNLIVVNCDGSRRWSERKTSVRKAMKEVPFGPNDKEP